MMAGADGLSVKAEQLSTKVGVGYGVAIFEPIKNESRYFSEAAGKQRAQIKSER